jgi:hypothetical protein
LISISIHLNVERCEVVVVVVVVVVGGEGRE